jgi:alkanesulfonate monooxygenase SsuD/methylene tetrahydromethanopterin reductase-like flavin-dependent oxidoreductase (luciferase family)
MDAGLMMTFRNPPDPRWNRPWTEVYADQLAQVKEAEDLGFGTVWLSEHHFSEDGYSPGLVPIASAIAATTSRIRIGSCILTSTFQHPLRLAEDAAIVDIISGGRVDLGIGGGYGVAEFEGFGIPIENRMGMLREGIDILLGAWREDPFDYEGRYYNLRNVSLMPKPVQDPMPLWVGAQGPRTIERIARLGCHLVTAGGDMSKNRDYDDCLRKHGRNPDDFNISLVRVMWIAETREQAWEQAGEHLHYMMEVYSQWQSTGGTDAGIKEAFALLPGVEDLKKGTPAAEQFLKGVGIFVGTPAEIVDDLTRLASEGRITHLAAHLHLPGMSTEMTSHAMRLFASDVIPHLP